ncbi:(2Fe-2S)-binding protein [bacterium]|nr:(2Fe-2S)-binding protein [bacterium]
MKKNQLVVQFKLNGRMVSSEVSPTMTMLDLLREKFFLTATKEGCGKGECGACTILLNGLPVNSCLQLAAALSPEDEVTSLEGLVFDPLLKKIQNSFVQEGAVQCGFCTPGMLVSSYAVLKSKKNPSDQDIKEGLAGNICRCTGYMKIMSAVKKAATEE